jgi:hypothetical protein
MWSASQRSKSEKASTLDRAFSRSVVKAGRGRPRGDMIHGRACRAEKGDLVSTGSGDDERAWAADKRDFVADRRDEVADERDRVADTRDGTADDREAELDKRERQLDARAAELGGSAESLERLHSGLRPVPDSRRRDRTEMRRGRNGR